MCRYICFILLLFLCSGLCLHAETIFHFQAGGGYAWNLTAAYLLDTQALSLFLGGQFFGLCEMNVLLNYETNAYYQYSLFILESEIVLAPEWGWYHPFIGTGVVSYNINDVHLFAYIVFCVLRFSIKPLLLLIHQADGLPQNILLSFGEIRLGPFYPIIASTNTPGIMNAALINNFRFSLKLVNVAVRI